MNREQVLRALLILSIVSTVAFGALTVLMFLAAGITGSGMVLGTALFTTVVAGGSGIGAWALSQLDSNDGVGSVAEQQLLTSKQQRELRRARGEVVMEKALIEVEHERQNIVHQMTQDANDPSTPPYLTGFEQKVEHQLQSAKVVRLKKLKGDYACIATGCEQMVNPDEPFCRRHGWDDVD